MTLWNPEYRVKIAGSTVTSSTLGGLTITSGRTDIYSQPVAGYLNLSLIETNLSAIPYDINDSVTVEVKDSSGAFVVLFGGFITDLNIAVQYSGSTAISQRIEIIGAGALARLARAVYEGNLSENEDGDQIYDLISTVLFDTWLEVPAATTWATYDPTTTWAEAENSGLGEIDRPGDYLLEALTDLNDSVYNIATLLANSGLGYLYEDAEGRIGYADSTHRSEYLSTYGYVDLSGNHAIGNGLSIIKRAGDVRNSITIAYKATGNQTVTDSDTDSISLYGQLATTITTTLKHQADAEAQAAFYLAIRAYPQFEMKQITFPVASSEIDNLDRDALLGIFMGMPVNIQNLPSNMAGGEFQGFVEGWTWQAGYNRLELTMTVSPVAYSLQAFRWNSVPAVETWNTLSPTLTWLDATIVA
jgi:hypothetical protein